MCRRILWLLLAAFVVVVDQVTKLLAVQHIPYGFDVEVLPFLQFTLIYNTGAAFSFLSQADGWQRWMFIGIGVVACLVFVIWLIKIAARNNLLSFALSLILGGAVGNLWDRVHLGYVIDFIDIYYKDWHWPAFNIADSAIMLGALLVIIDLFKSEGKSG